MKEFPSMVHRIKELDLQFLFGQPFECNLSLMRDFYANSYPYDRDFEVKIRGQVITFNAHTLNAFLRMPEVDPKSLKLMYIEPPYAHIRHFLCVTCLTIRWMHKRGGDIHLKLPFNHINREARVWAKIIYTCLLQATHITNMTRDRVFLSML